jgi:hypothetical protein
MNNSSKEFIKFVRHQCKRYKFSLILSKDSHFTEDGNSYGGYFSAYDKTIAVSNSEDEQWLISTLVHEYSHFEQWIYEDPVFFKLLRGGLDAGVVLSKWINGVTYKNSTIKRAIQLIRDCELDCERRALVNIDKFNLSINKLEYCQESNAYLYFHNYVKKKRKWEFKNSPIDVPEILTQMPTDLNQNYGVLPRYYELLFDEYLN